MWPFAGERMFHETTLFNRNFILACLCNLTFSMAGHMLIPVLPLYLTAELGASTSMTGIIVSIFAISALVMRPFAGYLVDFFQRRSVFLLTAIPFVFCAAGYTVIASLAGIAVLRLFHGATFSANQTLVTTLAVDAIPVNKLGTGIGIYGILATVSMALGPMFGLMLQVHSYGMTFLGGAVAAMVSLALGMSIKMRPVVVEGSTQKRLALENFIFFKALWLAFALMLTTFSFGLVINYISLFAREKCMDSVVGLFFMFFAAGMFVSRIIGSPFIDRGYFLRAIIPGKAAIVVAFYFFVNSTAPFELYLAASFMGIGYGIISPTYQTRLLQLADEDKKGMANSTFFLTWDVGIGLAMLTGGFIADHTSLAVMFETGAVMVVLSALYLFFATRAVRRKAATTAA